MANGKKGKNGNGGKKKTQPVKPPTSRRGNGKKKPIQNLAPAEGKIANKLITNKKYRDSAFSGFLKGITFGLYKP